jgi:hypothetical protein
MKEYFMNHYAVKAMGLGFFALLFFVSSSIKAQTHACGGARAGNEVQVGEAPGGNGVAPTPLCDWVSGSQSQGSQPPPVRWADQWGAIVTDDSKGLVGFSTNVASRAQAEQLALADCRAKGGNDCRVEAAYINQCAAMIVGDKHHGSASAATIDQAISLGIKACANGGDTNCHVYYTGCSLPQRIE